MEFKILGPFEVYDEGGSRIRLPTGRESALLVALLLHRGRVVSVDALIDALWGERPPSTAAKAIQGYVSHLRRLLGPDAGGSNGLLVTQAPGYVLRVDDEQLDAARFERLATRGSQALEEGSAAEALETLETSLGLWRGHALAEFEFADFAQSEIQRLEERRLEVVEDRIDALLALGRVGGLVSELESLVHANPLRERLRGQLMLALHRSGRQADALQVYREGVRLTRELGLEPSAELRQLERSILEQDSALAAPRDPTPALKAPPTLPTGTVTLLWSDVEGSTIGLRSLGAETWALVLARHLELMRAALANHAGIEVDTQGDAFFAVFSRAEDAIAAAVEAQRTHAEEVWPGLTSVSVRIGLHSGTPTTSNGRYVGLDVHRVARVGAAAHGGEILCSTSTAALGEGDVPPGVRILDLGLYQLTDFPRAERLHRVVADGLNESFPPPAAPPAASPRRQALVIAAIAAVVAVAVGAGAFAITRAFQSEPAVVVVAPAIAVIDPDDNRIVASIRVGSRPVTIAADENAVWVGDSRDGTVTRIDAVTRETRSIGIGAPAVDLAVHDGNVWVATGGFGEVVRIDAEVAAVAQRITLGDPEDPVVPSASSIAAGDEGLWVGAFDGVVRIATRSGEIVEQVDLGKSPALQIDLGQGAVWATTIASKALRIEAGSAQQTAEFYAGTSLFPVVVDQSAVWVGSGGGQIWALDPITGASHSTVSIGSPVEGLALGAGSVWAAAFGEGELIRIDASTAAVESAIPLTGIVGEVVFAHGLVWVTVSKPEEDSG